MYRLANRPGGRQIDSTPSAIEVPIPDSSPALDNANNQRSLNNIHQASFSGLQENRTIHDFIGTNIELQVNDAVFRIHESKISKFASLHQLIEDARRANPQSNTLEITVHGSSELASDFLNTFELLSGSQVEPVNFNTKNLVSAARISATYDYPALRAFSIEQLEALSLNSIERFQIGRALDFRSWEERACQELSERDEMITKEEMLVLGVDSYFEITNKREKRYRDGIVRPQVP